MITKAFLDLDGTVHLSGTILDNVDREIRRLATQGIVFHYMTNNTSISSQDYMQKLQALNLPLHDTAVISPTLVLAQWLREQGHKRVYSVATDSFRAELQDLAGVQQDPETPDCVLIAFDRELTYSKIETACQLINSGIPYYLTHIDLACPSDQGPIPDCGSIRRLIEGTTGIAPQGHFGKPGDRMLAYLKTMLGPQDHALVAGDRIYTDVAIGLKLGATTVLVCTGEYSRSDGDTGGSIDESIIVADSLAAYLRQL